MPVAILVVVLFAIGGVMAAEEIQVGRFSALDPGDSPGGWSPLSFPKAPGQTRYALTEEDGRVVVRAHSQVSASALLRNVNVDPSQHPYLHWSWKTDESCFAGNWRDPATDDFPLRLFVLFEGSGGFFSFFNKLGSDFSGDAVVYLGGSGGGPASPVPSTHDVQDDRTSHLSDRIKVVPLGLEMGTSDDWRRPVRNVRADYLDLFGKEPGAVSGVAIMSDTDNSGTECVSFFGDIYFSDSGA